LAIDTVGTKRPIFAADLIVVIAGWDASLWSYAALIGIGTALVETSGKGLFIVDIDLLCTGVDAGIVGIDQLQSFGAEVGLALGEAGLPLSFIEVVAGSLTGEVVTAGAAGTRSTRVRRIAVIRAVGRV
jgi:hypothetical protein